MDRKDNQYPQGETVRILVEFPEVAITSIVFLKGIYPPGDFEIRKYVNLVVHSARHPELRDYIHSAVSGLHPFIQKSYGLRVEEADLEFSLRSLFIELPFAESLTRVLPQDVGNLPDLDTHYKLVVMQEVAVICKTLSSFRKILRPDDERSCNFDFAGHVWLVKLCGREVFNSSTSRGFDVKKPVVVPKDHQNL